MLGKVGAWLAGLAGLVVIAAIGLVVFEGVSHWPASKDARPTVVTEAEFRRCPAVVRAAPRPAGAPVDDLAGIRPGLSRQDAENLFQCMAGDYRFAQGLQAYEATGKARQVYDLFTAERDGVIWRLGLFGQKPNQTVALIRRDATFSPGRGPVISTMEAELLRHFGPAHEAHDLPTGGRQLTWTYRADGKPVRVAPVEGAPGYLLDMARFMADGFVQSACAKHARFEADAAPGFDVRCGLTIRVAMDSMQQDRERAWRVRQVIIDQAGLAKVAGVTATPG